VAREDRPPVREVPDRRERVAADRRQLVGFREQERVRRDRREHTHQRGQQPASSPQPEGTERDPAPVVRFREQQRGDEESREHEEGVDPEEAAGQMSAVEEQDAGDGQAAQPVERRLMRQAGTFIRAAGRAERRADRHALR
jgi:hypothetical protein